MATRDSHAPSVTSLNSGEASQSPSPRDSSLFKAAAKSSGNNAADAAKPAPSSDTAYVLACASMLKERAEDLRPMGPTTNVFLSEDGPIGVHISQAGPNRVVIVGTPVEFQAYKSGKIRFADQVLQVGSNSTAGLKMKQVKVLIADASRPVLIKLQPLCFAGEGRPIVPPEPPTFGYAKEVWAVTSRAWALEKVGEPTAVRVKGELVRWVRAHDKLVLAECGDSSLLGLVIDRVEGRPVSQFGDRELANSLVAKDTVELTLQRCVATAARTCIYCDERGWLEAKFCWHCGESQL